MTTISVQAYCPKLTVMSNKTPIFPISDPHSFNDYGFDPQIDYFQTLKEAKRHKEEESFSKTPIQTVDSKRFKSQKRCQENEPTAKDKKRWWKRTLFFFRGKRTTAVRDGEVNRGNGTAVVGGSSKSGPVYVTESRSGSSTPYRSFCPSAGSVSPAQKNDVAIPYVSLREFNVEHQQHQHSRMSTSAMPIYLVT